MEIGIDSFAAILPSPTTGILPSATDRMADLLEEVEVADRVGLDVFGIGEHHRAEFLDSARAIILAAAAARTNTISNSLSTGLVAFVFTNNMERADYLSRELQVGSVALSCFTSPGADAPFGGYRDSRIGREGGTEMYQS